MDRIDESDEKEHRMTAPLLKWYTDDRELNGYYLEDEKDLKLFEKIESIFRELPPSDDQLDYRCLWISIPRGPIEDFGDFEDFKEEGLSYEDFVSHWKCEHPDDADWYVLQYERIPDGRRYIVLGRLVLFYGNGEKEFRRRSRNHTNLLEWLTVVLREQVDSVKAGTYRDRVLKELPLGYRKGVVRRSDVWKSGFWTKEADLDGTTDEDIERFSELVGNGIEDVPDKRIPSMTLNDYLALCSMCFRIRGENTDGMSLKEQYKRFADGRDEGMLELDPDDPDAFRQFQRNVRSGHVWEIRFGHGYSRMHLYPMNDERGWYLVLRGCFDRTDFIHIALSLSEKGMPVEVMESTKVLRAIRGEDGIGIVPRRSYPFYCSGEFRRTGMRLLQGRDDGEVRRQDRMVRRGHLLSSKEKIPFFLTSPDLPSIEDRSFPPSLLPSGPDSFGRGFFFP